MHSPRTAVALLALVVLVVSACGVARIPLPGGGPAKPVDIPSGVADQPSRAAEPPDPDFPKPSAPFAAHFTDPLYHDEGEELAPFGSDEGSDTLYGWVDRRHELNRCTTLRWMIEQDDPAGALDDPADNGPDVDGFVVGAGFALILLTGHIDTEGKQLTLDALHRTYSFYADSRPREPAVMIRDLESFPATDCTGGA
ncbi:hypothetical protein [uncultured Friedmanniella sp.]|uniref:hypothetical protein n=1 Tax=uncultured Friedmanniella sp. TaxID=335381 RepID=UPI0035CAEF1E